MTETPETRDEELAAVIAPVLHDAECSDHTCEPQAFAGKFSTAREIADVIVASGWRSPAVVAGRDAELAEAKGRANRILAINHSALRGLRDGEDPQWVDDTLAEGSRAMVRDEEIAELRAEIERLREELESARRTWRKALDLTVTERDEARAVLGAVAALADEWACNCGGPSPEGHHEMHCDSFYADQLDAVLAPVSGAVEGAGDEPDCPSCSLAHPTAGCADMGCEHNCQAEIDRLLPSSPVAAHEQEVRGC